MRSPFILICVYILSVSDAHASVTEITNRTNWQSAVGNNYSQLTFTGFADFTQITTQYANVGVIFTDPDGDFVVMDDPNFPDDPAFPNDGSGLWGGHQDYIELAFSRPMYAIAADFPGLLQYELYFGGRLVFESGLFGGGGAGWFGGLVSDQPFDSVRIFDPTDHGVYIDDLYFGPPIPAPGAVALFVLAGISPRRRRRRA